MRTIEMMGKWFRIFVLIEQFGQVSLALRRSWFATIAIVPVIRPSSLDNTFPRRYLIKSLIHVGG